jgi:hypothetical protein
MGLTSVAPSCVESDRDEVIDEPIGPGCAFDWDTDGGLAGCPDWHIVGFRDRDGDHWLGWTPKNFRSHSLHSEILFARSVTISEKRHQVGGLGDPPKLSRRAMYAILPKIVIHCAAAEAAWFIQW